MRKAIQFKMEAPLVEYPPKEIPTAIDIDCALFVPQILFEHIDEEKHKDDIILMYRYYGKWYLIYDKYLIGRRLFEFFHDKWRQLVCKIISFNGLVCTSEKCKYCGSHNRIFKCAFGVNFDESFISGRARFLKRPRAMKRLNLIQRTHITHLAETDFFYLTPYNHYEKYLKAVSLRALCAINFVALLNKKLNNFTLIRYIAECCLTTYSDNFELSNAHLLMLIVTWACERPRKIKQSKEAFLNYLNIQNAEETVKNEEIK